MPRVRTTVPLSQQKNSPHVFTLHKLGRFIPVPMWCVVSHSRTYCIQQTSRRV
jgi:hypothetical protein